MRTRPILAQLPKMRMNFFGLHTYPEGGVGPEPAVWIGPPDEIGEDGQVLGQLSVPAFRDEQRDRGLGLSAAEDE